MFTVDWDRRVADQIIAGLNASPKRVEKAMANAAETVRTLVVERTPTFSGYAKRSWGKVEKTSGGFSFGNSADYSQVLDEGTTTANVGPKTMMFQGKLYSDQAPGGMIDPILESERVMSMIIDSIAQALLKGVGA